LSEDSRFIEKQDTIRSETQAVIVLSPSWPLSFKKDANMIDYSGIAASMNKGR